MRLAKELDGPTAKYMYAVSREFGLCAKCVFSVNERIFFTKMVRISVERNILVTASMKMISFVFPFISILLCVQIKFIVAMTLVFVPTLADIKVRFH